MWITGLAALLFLIGGIIAGVEGDSLNMIVAWAISAGLAMVAIYFFLQNARSNRFLNVLVDNIREVEMGVATYEGATISLETEITQFQACISALIISTRNPSRYLIVGHNHIFVIGFVYSLMSLILGWWGIPWGPIYTIQTLWRNLRGGYRSTVGEILEELRTASAAEEGLT